MMITSRLRIIVFCSGMLLLNQVFSQDFIYKKDNTSIQCIVIGIADNNVTYKRFDNQTGPTYTIPKSDIDLIHYANGTSDRFGSTIDMKPQEVVPNNSPNPAAVATKSDVDSYKKFLARMALDTDDGSVFDVEFSWYPVSKHVGLGCDFYVGGLNGSDIYSNGTYLYIEGRIPFSPAYVTSIWMNAGLNISTLHYYDNWGFPLDSTSSGFLWEVGADFNVYKGLGITLYSPKFQSAFVGLLIAI